MKFDKCGGCTVLAVIRAVASMKLAVNVVGIVPSVENMPQLLRTDPAISSECITASQ